MDATLQIRTIQPDDRQAVLDLHRQHYWRSHCLLLNADFYRWQFEQPPESSAAGGDQSVVAVGSDGRLLSYLGLAPARCTLRDWPVRAAHLITWLSDPAARGKGLGHALMHWVTERYDFLFGRSVTPAALAVYRRLGFRYFPSCQRWVAVLDADAAGMLAVDASEAARRRLAAREIPVEHPPPFHVGPDAPKGMASLAAEALAASLTFERTAEYCRWRYDRHPYLHYVYLWLGADADPDAAAVLRVEDVSGRPGRVLRVTEFLARAGHGRRLAEAVMAHGRRQGCAFADLFGVSERFVAGWVAAGGFNILEEPELRLPHLFQPWDAGCEPPGVLFFARRDAARNGGVSLADDVSRIHISKGDGNLDWPSWTPAAGEHIAPAVGSYAA
jgi:GNAT superfamily N-acetyltransferase